MTDKVEFELVTPEKLLLSQPVDMVVAPGTDGYFGVLIEHIPFITSLRPGVVETYEGDRLTEQYFIDGGFAQVTRTHCTILVDSATKLSEIDRGEAEQALQNLIEDLEDAKTDAEREAIQAKLEVAEVKVQFLAGNAPKVTVTANH